MAHVRICFRSTRKQDDNSYLRRGGRVFAGVLICRDECVQKINLC